MSETNKSSGVSFASLLAILFIALKLTGTIAWSWLWVSSPIWIPFSLIVIIFAFAGVMALINVLAKKSKY